MDDAECSVILRADEGDNPFPSPAQSRGDPDDPLAPSRGPTEGRDTGTQRTPPDSDRVREIIGSDTPISAKIIELSGVRWGVCPWGSAQYSQAYATFRALGVLAEHSLPPFDLFQRQMPRMPDDLEVMFGIIPRNHNRPARLITDTPPPEDHYPDYTVMMPLNKGDDILRKMKKDSWDLWSASRALAKGVFADSFDSIVSAYPAPGRGPVVNRKVQSDNYATGARCFLLMKAGVVKDEASFGGFDT